MLESFECENPDCGDVGLSEVDPIVKENGHPLLQFKIPAGWVESDGGGWYCSEQCLQRVEGTNV